MGNSNRASSPYSAPQHSTWHSPVPYLFGGLAAMLGLIAFALLILACSYWKLSGYLQNNGENQTGDRDLESGEHDESKKTKPWEMQEKFLVIMAGDTIPTYLAKPVLSFGGDSNGSSASTSRSSSFGESYKSCTCGQEYDDEGGDQMRNGNTESHDTSSDHSR